MKNNDVTEKRTVRTTYLVFDWEAINWAVFESKCQLVRYRVPYKQKKDYDYFARMHNWYKQESDFPCYLHTYGPYLYVLYPSRNQVTPLKYNDSTLTPEDVDLHDQALFHAIVKTLVSDYFLREQQFVSNAYFFLRSSSANFDFLTALKINISQNWRNPHEFAVSDEAVNLRKLRDTELDTHNWWKSIHYGRIVQNGMTIFKQLKPNKIGSVEKKSGIYVEYSDQKNRASITFHSVSSLEALEETRSYLLNMFLDKFIKHLHDYGLVFRQKTLEMQKVSILSTNQMDVRQLPIHVKRVFVVDDRWMQNEDDNFLAQFVKVANKVIQYDPPIFEAKTISEITPGDLVLRLQDYGQEEFVSSDGLLKDQADPKQTFYQSLSGVVKQTLNINANTEKKQRDLRMKKKNAGEPWTFERYFTYSVPDPDDKSFQLKLEVCYNQLVLKDIIMFPNDAIARLPQLCMMSEKVFLVDGHLAYMENGSLRFHTAKNNLEYIERIIRDLTGKSLIEDVLRPSIEHSKPNADFDNEGIEKALKRPFIIGRNYVFEIHDNDGRMVYEDLEIRDRFEKLEEDIPTNLFYPKFPLSGKEPFTEEQLRGYADFLDEYVLEPFISFNDLKNKYGLNVRDDKGKIVEKGGGFYPLLGIQKDTKFREYLENFLGLKFESVRDQTVIPVYQGIWYNPETRQYLVGSKDGRNYDQERGFVFREIVCHSPAISDELLSEILQREIFPMLEVNFIRFRNYTVYPFPFKLIDMWKEEIRSSTLSS